VIKFALTEYKKNLLEFSSLNVVKAGIKVSIE